DGKKVKDAGPPSPEEQAVSQSLQVVGSTLEGDDHLQLVEALLPQSSAMRTVIVPSSEHDRGRENPVPLKTPSQPEAKASVPWGTRLKWLAVPVGLVLVSAGWLWGRVHRRRHGGDGRTMTA